MRSFKKALLLLMCVAMAGIANALPFETTTISGGSFAAGTKYYRMKFIINDGSAQYVYIDSDVKTTSDQSSADLFAFVGDETNGFKIYKKGDAFSVIYMTEYNIGWSNRKQIDDYSADLINYGSASSYTNWLLHDRGNGYYSFYQTGLLYYTFLGIPIRSSAPTTMNYSSSGTLSTWTNDAAKTSDNTCRIQFEEVPTAVTFTYSYIMNGVEMGTESIVGTIGESFPSPTLPAFCSASTPAGTVTASDADRKISIGVTWSAPVDFSTSLENAKWYLMTAGRDNGVDPKVLPVMRYKEGQNYITLNTADKDFSLSSADQWAFVGNPYEGFKIYNRFNKGRLISSTALTSSNDGNTNPYVSSDALPSGYTELWDLHVQQQGGSPSTIDGGFSISQHGQSSYKMNKRWYNDQTGDPRLAYWTGGADNGSTFTATQVLPSTLITYNAFEGDGYTTLYVDYPIAVTNAKVYTGQRNDAHTSVEMTLATDNIIPANTGVVLVKDGTNALLDQTYTISNEPGTVERGDISGTTTAITLTDDTRNNYRVFGLSNASPQTLGFFRPSSSVASIPANKAFYDLTGSGVQGFVLSFDGMETGITLDQIMQPSPEADKPAYDLSGRRVNHAAKGIYIIGGKKVIVK